MANRKNNGNSNVAIVENNNNNNQKTKKEGNNILNMLKKANWQNIEELNMWLGNNAQNFASIDASLAYRQLAIANGTLTEQSAKGKIDKLALVNANNEAIKLAMVIDSVINMLASMGKGTGTSSIYNILDGRICYGTRVHGKLATGLGNSIMLRSFMQLYSKLPVMREIYAKGGQINRSQFGNEKLVKAAEKAAKADAKKANNTKAAKINDKPANNEKVKVKKAKKAEKVIAANEAEKIAA